MPVAGKLDVGTATRARTATSPCASRWGYGLSTYGKGGDEPLTASKDSESTGSGNGDRGSGGIGDIGSGDDDPLAADAGIGGRGSAVGDFGSCG